MEIATQCFGAYFRRDAVFHGGSVWECGCIYGDVCLPAQDTQVVFPHRDSVDCVRECGPAICFRTSFPELIVKVVELFLGLDFSYS